MWIECKQFISVQLHHEIFLVHYFWLSYSMKIIISFPKPVAQTTNKPSIIDLYTFDRILEHL